MPHPNNVQSYYQPNPAHLPPASRLNHIGKLPIETFTEVIKILIQDSDNTGTTPLIISHVSKQWRNVMHNTAFLWDVLVLDNRRPEDKARFWMERSKGKLRELSVRSSAVFSRTTKRWSDVLRELAWGRLEVLRVEKWQVVKFLDRIGELESLNNLETLQIDNANPLYLFSPSIHNSNKSTLRNLVVSSSSWSRFRTAPLLVRGLTSLSLSNVKRRQECLHTILNLNPDLEYLSLSRVTYRSLPIMHIMSDPVTLDRLKTLRIANLCPLQSIFTVTMPNLDTLEIENQNSTSAYYLDRTLYQYSLDARLTLLGHTHLSRIVFRGCEAIGVVGPALPMDQHGLLSLLKSSPNLQQLEISHTKCDMNFVVELLASTYSYPSPCAPSNSPNTTTLIQNKVPPFCPNLTHVDFSGCSKLQTGPLLRMVKSRRQPDIPVQGQAASGCPTLSQPNPLSKEITSLIIDSCPLIDPGWALWLMNRLPHVSWKV